MAQKNMMGGGMAPPPASPANPTALNFQSDPNMRQQFKGFMSGLSKRAESQPVAQPLPSPMPMYTPAADIDIFQPMPMEMGGMVPRSTEIAGQPHMLSYITPGEAMALRSMGGSGQPGPAGIPAFSYEDEAFGGASSSAGFGGSTNFSSGGGGNNNTSDDDNDYTPGFSQTYTDGTPAGTTISGNTITGGTIKGGFTRGEVLGGDDSGGDNIAVGPVAFGIGARPSVNLSARTMPVSGGDALSNEIGKRSSYDDAPMNSRGLLTNQAQADAAMGIGGGFGATGATQSVSGSPTASGYDEFALGPLNLLGNVNLLDPDAVMRQALDSSARLMQDAYGQVAVNPELTGLPGGAAVVSGRPLQTVDEIMYNDTMMRTDMSPADMERIQRERAAQDITRRGGTVDVNPETGQLIANYPQTPSMLDTVPQSIPTPIGMPDEIRSMRDTFNDLDVFGPNTGGAPVTIGTPEPRPDTPFEQGAAAGERVAQGEPSGTSSDYYSEAQGGFGRERTEAGRTNRVADSGFGSGEIYRTKGDDLTQDEQNKLIENAMNRRTTVTLGLQDPRFGGSAPPLGTKDAVTVSSLDQLARRAGLAPGSFGGQIAEDLGFFGQSIANFGAKNAGKMYDNIVNKGHRPVYDNRGQIIATVNSLGQIGAGSRPINMDFVSRAGDDMFDLEGFTYDQVADMQASTKGGDNPLIIADQIRKIDKEVAERSEGLGGIGDAPPQAPSTVQPSTSLSGAAQVANPLQYGYGQIQGINPNLDNAANKFLSFLGGFAEGGEVEKFRGGGGVGRQDYQGGTMSGVTGDVSGSTTSDAASSRATEGVNSGTGRSFSGAELYGNQNMTSDNNAVQSVMATPVQRQTVIATPLDGPAPQAEKLVPVEGAQSQPQIQQQQIVPGNMIQTQAGPIDPASMSLSEKTSLIGEGLGNLLDFDLFSAPEVDGEMAARFEAAGFSPSAAASIATPTGGLFDIPESVPLGAAQTSYKQFATTPESKINMGRVDMGDRGFDFSGLGDVLARAYDATKQKLSTALDPVDYSNLDQLGQNLRNQ